MAKNRRNQNETGIPILGVRHLQCLLLFCAIAAAMAMRVNLSLAIVAMTDKDAANPDFGEYDWSEKTKSLLLSSFFWGYIVTQIPGGQLSQHLGAKRIVFFSLLLSSVLAILTPICAQIGGWKLVFAVRVAQGLSQGVLMPSMHTLMSKWAPTHERGALATYCYSGSPFGTVIMLASSGILASSIGWPSIFYISGGAGLVWVAAWSVWGASSPSDYKSISAEEKSLIEASLGQKTEDETLQPALKTPWLKFFTSKPFLVLALTHCSNNYGHWTLLTQIPSYLKSMMGLNIKSNALLSALPYTAMLLLGFLFAGLSSLLNKRKGISLSFSRKLFNTISQWVPMVTLVSLGYVGEGQMTLAVLLLTVTVGINAAMHLGFQVNHLDLSPNFAGTLMGITNCAGNTMSIIAPLVVGFVVTDEKNPTQWRTVFFIAAGVYFVGNLLFVLFGRADPQPWNEPQPKEETQKLAKESSMFDADHYERSSV